MEIKFICPYWGQEGTPVNVFFDMAIEAEYDGVEICLSPFPDFEQFYTSLAAVRKKMGFVFVGQQWLPPVNESFGEYKRRLIEKLEYLISFQPDFINSHTGKDFFSFDENCRLIETCLDISLKSGIKILHETHRGRFAFHAYSLLPYLEKFPELELVADLSHWCTVSESLLQDQEDILEKIFPHVAYIHARVGYEHSPQVNDFRAPEWKEHAGRFFHWWQKIIDYHKQNKRRQITICPEFGPIPYMPTAPFTQKPLSQQWDENLAMKDILKKTLSL